MVFKEGVVGRRGFRLFYAHVVRVELLTITTTAKRRDAQEKERRKEERGQEGEEEGPE